MPLWLRGCRIIGTVQIFFYCFVIIDNDVSIITREMRHWFTETSTVSLASLPLEFGEKKRWKVYGYLYYFHNTSIITSLIKRITHFERLYGLQSLWVRIPLDFFQKPWFCCGYYICHFILLHASDHVWISINRELVWRSTKVIAVIKEKKV